MDTFNTRKAQHAGGYRHHSAQGFCTVCGTVWPCWRGLRDDTGSGAIRRSSPPPLVAGPLQIRAGLADWQGPGEARAAA
jgi:hypothetical protein